MSHAHNSLHERSTMPARTGLKLCLLAAAVATLVLRSARPSSTPHGLPHSKFRAVTVLHAPCNTLAFTLANFAGNLGSGWPIVVFHNDALTEFVEHTQGVHHMLRDGRLHLVSLERHGFDTLPSSTTDGYSKLLTSSSFWRFLNADHVLIFQTDSVLCSLSPWTVHDFLQYDYVGAPWNRSAPRRDVIWRAQAGRHTVGRGRGKTRHVICSRRCGELSRSGRRRVAELQGGAV